MFAIYGQCGNALWTDSLELLFPGRAQPNGCGQQTRITVGRAVLPLHRAMDVCGAILGWRVSGRCRGRAKQMISPCIGL